MKPKTERQKRVMFLHKRLKPTYKNIYKWALNNCIKHFGYVAKDIATCLCCAEDFSVKKSMHVVRCPKCKRKLELVRTRKMKYDQLVYVGKMEQVEEYQVLRFYYIKVFFKKGEIPKCNMYCVFEDWISPDLDREFVARVFTVGFYYDKGIWTNDLELRNIDRRESILRYMDSIFYYDKGGIRGDLLQKGINFDFIRKLKNIDLIDVIQSSSASVAETFIKRKNTRFLKEFIKNPMEVKKNWRSIKIALKNNYTPLDIQVWFDYLENLRELNKDVLSPKYILPKNLILEHNKYMLKRYEKLEKEGMEGATINKTIAENVIYIDRLKKYFPLHFQNKNISIEPLKSIEEVKMEGNTLNHCVYVNGYYKKESRLLFSAKVNSKPTETIEFDLYTNTIIQQRGYGNCKSIYHQEIEKLFLNCIPQIQQITNL
ncbi:PcfJ domain-containing protein [Myroides odoratimimus]|uniref:PcfJ-like protein n=1 Tax=Myroides odoratimimus TaxID=76832 RepID=A0AAI8C9K0_9FLAO|nr:PcfJ domain-containing protein [Myroides odoratimimus]ALU28451.1 hypothetical protein AS202_19920 [Myroides odoratimimus]